MFDIETKKYSQLQWLKTNNYRKTSIGFPINCTYFNLDILTYRAEFHRIAY